MGQLRKIEYGVPSGNDALTVRFGIEQGIFENEGLDLSTRIVFGGPELAAAFDRGELPIGSLGSPSGIPAMASGKKFRIIASGCRQKAHLYLGARRGIHGYEQLKGKRIGLLSIGSCPSWIIHKMLSHHGLDANADVTLVALHDRYPQVIDLLEQGEIDACLVTEPNLAIGESRGVLDVWSAGYEEAYLPEFQWIVRVANTNFIEQEPEVVKAVLRGCRRSAHHAVEHRQAFHRFVADYYDTNATAAKRAMDREMPRYQLDCLLDMPGLQNSIDMLVELGGIKHRLKPSDIVDPRFRPAF